VIVLLSGPDREPYWLELDPERAAVLRQNLAGPEGEAQQLEASARRALDALAMLILNNPDPGTEALGAQYELRQALFGQPSEFPAIRVWQIQAQRRDGSWNNYSAPIVDGAEAHGDYAETIANSGQRRAFRLVSSVTTQTVEAQHSETQAAADCPYGEGPGDGSGCIKPAGHDGDHVVTSGVTVVPCSRAVLHQPHIPHSWWPQPGMAYVQCPGHSFDTAAVSQPGKEA
jgi:hypothetical protein